MRDKQLRPDAYAKAEEELKVLIADVITAVQNGMDIDTATKRLMRKSINQQTHHLIMTSNFHLIPVIEDIPAVGMEMFTVARKLLLEAAVK